MTGALVLALLPALAAAADWKAGAAAVDITPSGPLWMAGFAARTKPSEGVIAPLKAKALAVEDAAGTRVVLVTADLVGVSGSLTARVAARLERERGLPRAGLLLNASHTHGGPVVEDVTPVAYPLTEALNADIARYTRQLEDKLAAVAGEALGRLQPATLRHGSTSAPFAVNFRTRTEKGWAHLPNPEGVVDRTVPLLRVDSGGKPLAVVFGYACHPTVVPGVYGFHGDYAGFAREHVEKRFPGATALFVQGFGGDAKVHPRGTVELARAYGGLLGEIVAAAAEGKLQPVAGPLSMAYGVVPLAFARVPDRAELDGMLKAPDAFRPRLARYLLATLEKEGRLPAAHDLPAQVWRFGGSLTMIALGGETLIDYAIRLRRELPGRNLFFAGYSNDVFAYIPSERVLAEGGYEGGEAMVYFGRPSAFAPGLEDRIIDKVRELTRECETK